MVPYLAFSHSRNLACVRRAIALLHSAFVPHVVAQSGGVVAIALHQRGQELLGLGADIFIVQTEGRAAGGAAGIDGGKGLGTVARNVSRLRILVPHPLRRPRPRRFRR